MAAVLAVPTAESPLHGSDRDAIESELRAILPTPGSSPVSACMDYAVMGHAQRLRPLLAMRVGAVCHSDRKLTLRAAAAVELLHCASLIVDDLPCMDNDATRRNRPSAHVAYGESTALLSAFGLVALAARSVLEQVAPEEHWHEQRRFQLSLLRTLDCCSLIGGQVLDLQLTGDRRQQCRDLLNDLKTVPLFVLAIDAGLAYGDQTLAAPLRQFGREYGVALQMTDDYLDGELASRAPLARQFAKTAGCLDVFGPSATPLLELVEYLDARAQNRGCR